VNKITILTLKETYRDGGSKLYKDGNNLEYFLDNNLFSSSKGILFIGNYTNHSEEAVGTYQLSDTREIITQKEKIIYEKPDYTGLYAIIACMLAAICIFSLTLYCSFTSNKNQKVMSNLKPFIVTRPYFNPEKVAIYTTTRKKALEIATKTYGCCMEATVQEVKNEGVILSKK